jgi:hypothetical protein
MTALLTAYLQHSYLVLPLLAALWGMVALRTVQVWQPELAYAREVLVCRSVGRSVWRRAYDRWVF